MTISKKLFNTIDCVKIENVTKKYGCLTAVKQVNLEVCGGELLILLGPSGCGKTTLLRIIAGLENATQGKVLLDGKKITKSLGKIGLIFQEYALFPWQKIIKNIEFGLEVKKVKKKERRQEALNYIKTFGLSGFENKYPRDLSGGMQQRVAIARTLITNPDVVLMDEPFGSLDSQTRYSMQDFLLRIWQDKKETFLFVTHNVDEAIYLSDRIIALSKRPAEIVKIFDIPFPRPRDRTGSETNKIRKEIFNFLDLINS